MAKNKALRKSASQNLALLKSVGKKLLYPAQKYVYVKKNMKDKNEYDLQY